MSDVFEPGLLKQKAVYWAPLGQDPGSGAMDYDEPIEVKCRWSDMQTLFITSQAEQAVSRAHVLVDRDMEIGGVLWQGDLESLDDQDEPMKNKKAMIIMAFNKVPDENAKMFVREAVL